MNAFDYVAWVVHALCPVHNCLDKLPSPCAFPVPGKIVPGNGPGSRALDGGPVLEAAVGLQSLDGWPPLVPDGRQSALVAVNRS